VESGRVLPVDPEIAELFMHVKGWHVSLNMFVVVVVLAVVVADENIVVVIVVVVSGDHSCYFR